MQHSYSLQRTRDHKRSITCMLRMVYVHVLAVETGVSGMHALTEVSDWRHIVDVQSSSKFVTALTQSRGVVFPHPPPPKKKKRFVWVEHNTPFSVSQDFNDKSFRHFSLGIVEPDVRPGTSDLLLEEQL